MPEPYLMPPCTRRPDGNERRVGLEVELGGLDIETIASIVADTFGGTPQQQTRFAARVTGPAWGDIRIEVDARPLKEGRHRELLAKLGIELDESKFGEWLETSIDELARLIVPCEIVMPPIPLSELNQTDALWPKLRAHDAEGTRTSLVNAFGLHLNPDIPRLDADGLTRYLRAFFVRYDWLVAQSEVDVARRLTPFITPFPETYVRRVLDPDYRPDIDGLVDDYLRDNPTRNRPLDMLPALATLRRREVMSRCEEPQLVSARPTFHYRLPNCELARPGWTPALDWNRWVEVERLAEDVAELEALARKRLAGPTPLGARGERDAPKP